MKEKLRSSRGVTLTELLVTLAIVSLIGTAMTVGISSAVKVYRDATRVYESETLCGTILTSLEDEFRFARNIRREPETGVNYEVIFDSQSFGKNVKVSLTDDGKVQIVKYTPPGAPAALAEDPAAPATPVPDTRLLADTAYTSKLRVRNCKIEFDKDDCQVTITVAVGPDEDNTFVEHTVTVAPVYN